jgi:hypothetical protein
VRLKQWSPDQAASSKIINQNPDMISLVLKNHRKTTANVYWLPEGNKDRKVSSGKLKATQDAQVPSKEIRSTFKNHSFLVEFADGIQFGPFIVGHNDELFVKTSLKEDMNGVVDTISEVDLPLLVSFTVENCLSTSLTLTNDIGTELELVVSDRDVAEPEATVHVLAFLGDVVSLSCDRAIYHKSFRIATDEEHHLVRFNDEM